MSTPVAYIEKWNTYIDGELNNENMRLKMESKGLTCTRYEFTQGTEFPNHTHSNSKKDGITTGEFLITIYGRETLLQPGDLIDVPAGVIHSAKVIGDDTVTFFDGMYV
eukprot:Filipodium_phascolosomae@DN661_c0_g1_i1.p1